MSSKAGSGGDSCIRPLGAIRPPVGCAPLDSSSEEEGYVSPYGCSSDDDEELQQRGLLDEMPAFSTHSLSPSARSLSPIDLEPPSPPRSNSRNNSTICSSNGVFAEDAPTPTLPLTEGFVSLDEVHSRIGLTPPDSERSRSRLNLETIFEDKFLETPPKKDFESPRLGQNLLRRSLRSRVLFANGSGSDSDSPGGGQQKTAIDGLAEQLDSKCTVSLD